MYDNSGNQRCNGFAIPQTLSARCRVAFAGGKTFFQGFYDGVFNVSGGNAGDRSSGRGFGLSMQDWCRRVVTVADAGFCGVGRNHAMPGVVEQQPRQQVVGLVA